MTKDAVQSLQGQIPAFPFFFQAVKKTDRLDIMLERRQPVLYAEVGEKFFSVVAKGRVADIMAECDCLDQILIQTKKTADGSGDPGDQLNVQAPMGDVVVGHQAEHLGLVDIPGVGPGVEDPVGVEGKTLAVALPLFLGPPQGLGACGS